VFLPCRRVLEDDVLAKDHEPHTMRGRAGEAVMMCTPGVPAVGMIALWAPAALFGTGDGNAALGAVGGSAGTPGLLVVGHGSYHMVGERLGLHAQGRPTDTRRRPGGMSGRWTVC
jgi:hypothetical protein